MGRREGLPVVFYFDKDSFPRCFGKSKGLLRAIAWMSSGQGYGKLDRHGRGVRARCSVLPTKKARNAEAAYPPE